MTPEPLFEFESSDALARFMTWVAPIMAIPVVLPILSEFGVLTWRVALIGCVVLTSLVLVIAAGLRSRIVIYSDRVFVQRKWFSISYQTVEGSRIDHVVYGGDWGDDYGAVGVVVDLDGKDVHIGNSKNMHFLHDALNSLLRGQAEVSRGAG